MKILIIGGSGILSSAVVDLCISKGYEVTMINRGNRKSFINPKANLIVCDIRDKKKVKECVDGLTFDTVVDFLVFTKEQLHVSLEIFGKKTKQYVFISSAQVYNTSIQKELVETDETPQPLWQYSVNKDICEKYLHTYCRENNINYTIVRPGVNYDNRRLPYGMYPPIGMHWTIIARIIEGKPIITWNNGENKLNLTRVEDFAKGIVGLLGNKKAYNESYNVCGDNVYSWRQVLETIGKILDKPVVTVDVPLVDYASELNNEDKEMLLGGRACDLVLSNAKLKEAVPEFQSTINLNDGIKATIDWYINNNYYQGIDYTWDAQQDRIISKYGRTHVKTGYYKYIPCSGIKNLNQRCAWELEYNKNNRMAYLIWKSIRKFICKPLNKIFR